MTSNAYIQRLNKRTHEAGALSTMTFAVKDVFAVSGHTNSAGNPTWLATHAASNVTARTIEQLLAQGATLNGLTHTDELMYSLNGENIHYGMPKNPVDETRICGGSSSGSASAVACNEATFALGTDTGGSVRIPAAYCGLYGIRPTHDTVSLHGVIPLAKSFDTVGWLARDAKTLAAVGDVLLPAATNSSPFTTLLLEQQSFQLVAPKYRRRLIELLATLQRPTASITLVKEGLQQYAALFRHIQGIEIWQQHGEWIEAHKPLFAPAIQERFMWTRTLDATCYEDLKAQQQQFTDNVQNVLSEGRLLVIPTIPESAPKRAASAKDVEDTRTKTMALTCIAGLSGCPQVTVPVVVDGLPIGLSFIAARGADRALLQFIEEVMQHEAMHSNA